MKTKILAGWSAVSAIVAGVLSFGLYRDLAALRIGALPAASLVVFLLALAAFLFDSFRRLARAGDVGRVPLSAKCAFGACSLAALALLLYRFWLPVPADRGPYLSWQSDPAASITITWESPDRTSREVLCSPNPDLASAMRAAAAERDDRKETGYFHYTATISGLTPDTAYHYQIPGFFDRTESFRTSPVQGGSFRFLLYGDSRQEYTLYENPHRRLVRAMSAVAARSSPIFCLNTGDLVSLHDSAAQWNLHFHDTAPLARRMPYFVVTGNHEYPGEVSAETTSLVSSLHEFPKGAGAPDLCYAFTCGDARFVQIAFPPSIHFPQGSESAVLTWLERELRTARQSARWVFVGVHVPPFSDVEETAPTQHRLVPLFHRHRVDAVFSGHQHYLQRIEISRGEDSRPLTYLVTGGGGAHLRRIRDENKKWEGENGYFGRAIHSRSAYHFYLVEVEADRATFTAYDAEGKQIDRFVLEAK